MLTKLQGTEAIIENENKKTDNDKVIRKDWRGGIILKKIEIGLNVAGFK